MRKLRNMKRNAVRLSALLLSLVMIVGALPGITFSAFAAPDDARENGNKVGHTEHIIENSRIADYDTTDSYKDNLLSDENGSRYAGRMWTDKSVFAYNENGADGNSIKLDMDTDGYDGSVGYNADFGHVFSALASSQVVNEYPPQPLDVMFVLDVSGSMGNDTTGSEVVSDPNKFGITAIFKTVQSINGAIDLLKKENPQSRFGIVIYGSTAAVLVPLGHYTGGTLTAEFEEVYGNDQGLHFKLKAEVQPEDGPEETYYADNAGETNNDAHEHPSGNGNRLLPGTGGHTTGKGTIDEPYHVGHITNPQAGLAAAMDQYITGNDELTFHTVLDNKEYTRLPAMIHLTDGQASDLAWIQPSAELGDQDAWKQTLSNWNNINWEYDLAYNSPLKNASSGGNNYYNASQLTGYGDASPVIFQTLMTAAYYKSAVEAHYNNNSAGAKNGSGEDVSLLCYSIYASDKDRYDSLKDNQVKATIDAILGPEEYFKDTDLSSVETNSGNLKDAASDKYIDAAYELFKKWKTYGSVEDSFTLNTTSANSSANDITIQLNTGDATTNGAYSEEPWQKELTNKVIEKNINYVPKDNFYQTGFDKLDSVFETIIHLILGDVFIPISGDNDAGMSDSITYQDPIGDYMEVKDRSVKFNGSQGEQTEDMSLLLFGEMYGLVRTAVYDYQFNDKYMAAKGLGQGVSEFPRDWYKGDDPASAERANNPDGLPEGFESADAAWGAGWTYRLGFKDLVDYIPSAMTGITDPKNVDPSTLTEQVKNTVYTAYRFDFPGMGSADAQIKSNELRINPIYGDEVPEALKELWNSATEDQKRDNQLYKDYDGVYRLSDIRVWTEDYGDYVDTAGAITPNSSAYDSSVYIDIPAAAVPTQLAEITLGPDGVLAYKTNLDKKNQSTPVRLFYTVGLQDSLIERDPEGNQTGVDIAKLSEEYIASHQDKDNNIWFLSNYYSNTPYEGYEDAQTATVTRGDPAVSFSAASDNRYYSFQKPLPLYAHAYREIDGALKAVDNVSGWSTENVHKGGNGATTWETYGGAEQQGSSWVGGEYMGVYDSEAAFNEAKAARTGDGMITDSSGVKYRYVDGGIIFMTDDLMDKVESNAEGYTDDSISFSSDDYFFIIEYYLPKPGTEGKDINGVVVPGTTGGDAIQYVVSRKGSLFGSGLHSENIDNGDMLCWTDMNGHSNINVDYYSRSDTGDNTRGEPTWQKLTYTDDNLRSYLSGIGLRSDNAPEGGKSSLETAYDYWTQMQTLLAPEIENAAGSDGVMEETEFSNYFHWAAAGRTASGKSVSEPQA